MLRVILHSIALITACLWLTAAWAVVRPEDEWFEQPGNEELWQEMWPVLNEWEFGECDLLTGPPEQSFAGIQDHFGQPAAAVAIELGVEPDSTEVLSYDLNLDGHVDKFDILELGYEVKPAEKGVSTAPSIGTNKWIVLRADFSNVDADYTTYDIPYFNERFFDENAPKPSCHDYYYECSYGAMSITGTVWDGGPGGDGWYKGDHTKNWYINNHGRWLVKEAVLAADADIDFSEFDVDGDGYVDTCILFYPDQVFSGGLWPHRSSGLNISVDGVIVDSYFITGYDTNNDSKTMTISAHEYGHILGLPDLYDIDYSSNGVGKWSLMSNNYDNNHLVPSVDPWCKIKLGWVDPIVITDDVTGYSLGCFQDNPLVLKVWTNGLNYQEYFLIANYQKKKTDASRPGEGLMVFHIDDSVAGNNGHNRNNKDENHKHVDVETARGYNDPSSTNPHDPLDDKQSSGHANDPWFSGNTDSDYTGVFNDTSNPHTRDYPNPGDDTYIELSNISAIGDPMTLDITVETTDAPDVSITSHSTNDSISGTVTVSATATPNGGRSISSVEFYCNEAFLGADTSDPYSLDFDSRTIYDGNCDLKAVAIDDQGEIDTDTVGVSVSNSAAAIPFSDDFEAGIGLWASYNPSGTETWEEKSTAYAGSSSAGVGDTSSGYDFDEHDSLVSIKFDLAGTTHPIARWRQRYRVAGGENTCKVYVTDDDGASFDLLKTYTGDNRDWHPQVADLSDYIGDEVHVVFRLDSTSLSNMEGDAGWWVDEFEVREISGAPSITGITPGDGSTLSGVETITVNATDDECIGMVEFIIDSTDMIYVDYTDPFTYDWNSDWVFNDAHTFKAVAYDADLQSDDLTVNWTTSNAGLAIPFAENFGADPGTAWRNIDDNGAGEWQWLSDAGHASSGGMRFAIPGQNYHDNMDNDWYISPTLDISGLTDPGFGFLHRYDIEYNYDYGRVYITTDLTNWTQLFVYSRENQGWRAAGDRLDSYDGDLVKLAFFFESDGGLVEGGWWLDEFTVDAAPQITDVSPASIVNGDTITITGTGFGNGPANDYPTVLVNGTAESHSSWSDTSISVVVDDASSGDVVVIRHGIESDGFAITVKPAPVSITDLDQL